MKVIRRSPKRSNTRSINTVDTAYVKGTPILFESAYPRATSPMRAGRILFMKRPIRRAIKASVKRALYPTTLIHLREHVDTQKRIYKTGRNANVISALFMVSASWR